VDILVRDNLAAVGLDDLMYKPAHHLSYGQKKRAALAAVLAMKPEVLILDEPTANLDPRQERIFSTLLAAYEGTLIIIEHDLLFLFELCDRAIVLADGRVHHDYGFRDLVSQPQALRDHGLDFSFRFTCCGHAHGAAVHHHHHHPTHEHGPDGRHLPPAGQCTPLIELQHYSFRYPDGTRESRTSTSASFPERRWPWWGKTGPANRPWPMCLLGLHQGEGSFLLDGRPLDSGHLSRLWQRVGMVFQHAADQLFCPSCREEVAFGPQQLGLPARVVEERVAAALDLVRLNGYDQRVPLHMSGGERKRLAIAAP
jgi:energy-coupling factor transport system ATP-binding protein